MQAAALTYQAVVYKNRLVQQTLKPLLLQGLIPIDMSGYALTFGTTRIPGEEIDVLKAGSPAARDTHIVVLRGSHIYRIPTEVNGEQVSQSSLERAFQEVCHIVPICQSCRASASLPYPWLPGAGHDH